MESDQVKNQDTPPSYTEIFHPSSPSNQLQKPQNEPYNPYTGELQPVNLHQIISPYQQSNGYSNNSPNSSNNESKSQVFMNTNENSNNNNTSNSSYQELDLKATAPTYSLLDPTKIQTQIESKKLPIVTTEPTLHHQGDVKTSFRLQDFWYPVFSAKKSSDEILTYIISMSILMPASLLAWIWFQIATITRLSPGNTPHSADVPQFLLRNIYNEQAEVNHILGLSKQIGDFSDRYMVENQLKRNPKTKTITTTTTTTTALKASKTLASSSSDSSNQRNSCCDCGNKKNKEKPIQRDVDIGKAASAVHSKLLASYQPFTPELYSPSPSFRNDDDDGNDDYGSTNRSSFRSNPTNPAQYASKSLNMRSNREIGYPKPIGRERSGHNRDDYEISNFNPFEQMFGPSEKSTYDRIINDYYISNYSIFNDLKYISVNTIGGNDGLPYDSTIHNDDEIIEMTVGESDYNEPSIHQLSTSLPYRNTNGQLAQSLNLLPSDVISLWREDEEEYARWILKRIIGVVFFILLFFVQLDWSTILNITFFSTIFNIILSLSQYLSRRKYIKRAGILTIDQCIAFPLGLLINLIVLGCIQYFVKVSAIVELLIFILFSIRWSQTFKSIKPQRKLEYQHHVMVVSQYLSNQMRDQNNKDEGGNNTDQTTTKTTTDRYKRD